MNILHEDNHLIIVNKAPGEIVQADKTGDRPLSEKVKAYIKKKYDKPGDVFLGVTHRLDRPVSGAVVFARTSKGLSRMNDLFRKGEVRKTYHAIVPVQPVSSPGEHAGNVRQMRSEPDEEGRITLTAWLTRNEKQNKSYVYSHEVPGSKKAVLDYRIIARGERYNLIEVRLHTGRHHQIRCQLAAEGMPIKGDLKYGSRRSNPDGSISLHSRTVEFVHPVNKETVSVKAPYPEDGLWKALAGEE